MNIADYIPTGKENAISRAELARRTVLPDRTIHDEIKRANRELAKHGMAILSSSGARGYWISEDPKEIEEYCRESEHRRRQQYLNDAPIRKLLANIRGEKTVEVRAHVRRLDASQQIDGQTTLEEG